MGLETYKNHSYLLHRGISDISAVLLVSPWKLWYLQLFSFFSTRVSLDPLFPNSVSSEFVFGHTWKHFLWELFCFSYLKWLNKNMTCWPLQAALAQWNFDGIYRWNGFFHGHHTIFSIDELGHASMFHFILFILSSILWNCSAVYWNAQLQRWKSKQGGSSLSNNSFSYFCQNVSSLILQFYKTGPILDSRPDPVSSRSDPIPSRPFSSRSDPIPTTRRPIGITFGIESESGTTNWIFVKIRQGDLVFNTAF